MSELHFKILVPNVAAGAIIGKKGEAIETIKRQTGARLKMSRADDFYPGTTERVCLIIGTLEACIQLHDYVMAKISKRPQNIAIITPTGVNCMERHKQVKILVPDSTAGIIIGKFGNFIERIKEESNAFIQVSQRPKDIRLFERCIVITGELKERRKAVEMILYKILENPDSACYTNCSYSQVREPVASAFSIGSPFAITYHPPVDMNYSNINSECKSNISASNLPDASPTTLTFGHESNTNKIDPLLCNQSLSMPLANANLDSIIPVIPWIDQSFVYRSANAVVNLTSCDTVSQPLVAQSNLTNQSEPVHSDLGLNQVFCVGHPSACCPSFMPQTYGIQNYIPQSLMKVNGKISVAPTLAPITQTTVEITPLSDLYYFIPGGQQGDSCLTTQGNKVECSVPSENSRDNNQSHSRYFSGESVDSAFTESVLSVKLQSSAEDFMSDLFLQQPCYHQNKKTCQFQTMVSPNSVYSVCSSTESCERSSAPSQKLLVNSQRSNRQNPLVNNESNDNFNRSSSNQIQTSEFACLPTDSYGSTVGGILLVGTVQQLHNTLNFLEWQAKQQQLLYSSTSGIIMTSTNDQVRNVSNLPPTTVTAYNGNPINFCHTTSFSSDVSLKLDTIQPWSIPRHLAPLSLNLPINNQC
ncbi:unnamed protein product [Schistosoma rodhaini]|uniref:RNA-binding protein Nova-1 n=2 Tax=Schistosoma mansoni TaxID=6183 RepID=A0A5K4EZW6_SCHMA|nr:unnamed protein product [Schistosoma rodhaini]